MPSTTEGFYDALAPAYDDLAEPDSLEIPQVLANVPRPAGRALDVGAGTGRLAIELARAGWIVDAIDISAGMIAVARAKASAAAMGERIQFLRADVTRDALPPGPFDLIVCIGCLFHIPSVHHRAVIATLAGRLVLGGMLIVDTEIAAAGGWPRHQHRTLRAEVVDEERLELDATSTSDAATRTQRARFDLQWVSGRAESYELTSCWMTVGELTSLVEEARLRVTSLERGWGMRDRRLTNALVCARRDA
ncbi:MAG TPA: class I SAM-dependent methyltransferase [Vicinamibacterales bacterium]|nr:class I SAM-dependent methyltransferase [Vicinamibacterales bacterium]